MRRIILMLALMLTMVSCKAQESIALPKGHTIGSVIESDETRATVNAGGRSLIVNGKLETGVEYNLVYEIVERRSDGVLIVNLIAAEHSAREGAKRRAKLLDLIR